MIVLDDRLLALRGQVREWAADFRAGALALDRDPDRIHERLGLPAVRYLSTLMIPPEYGAPPTRLGKHVFHGTGALERVVALEELACGDAGMMLGSPGPSMAGVLVELLADENQKQWFYGRLVDRPTWTFFALTEPGRGSDASGLQTSLNPRGPGPGGILTGAKRYIGNATRAEVGVVFARTKPGALGITAVLVDTAAGGFAAEPIETLGLRGARVSAVTLDAVDIPDEWVLGRHLSRARRGIWASTQTFHRLRPGVASIAIGIARAAYEYVLANRNAPSRDERDRLDLLGRRIEGARSLVHLAAVAGEAQDGEGHLASAAKTRACRLAEEVTVQACGFFGAGARLEHPMLDKFARDARGVEFMEGTGNIQKLSVFRAMLMGKFAMDTA